MLCFTSLLTVAQEAAFFQLAGRQLGSNTVYDLHVRDDGSMVAATEHGVAIISMAGVNMLTSRSALHNSYTSIQRDEHQRLYALNFRNQLYRIAPDSLELFLDLTEEFQERVLGYRIWGETVLVYSESQCRRYQCSTGAPLTAWNEKIARQVTRLNRNVFHAETHGADSVLFWGNARIVNDSILTERIVPTVASGLKYYHRGNEWFALHSNLGSVYSSRLNKEIDCNRWFDGNKLHDLGHTTSHLWVASNAGFLLFDPSFQDTIPTLVLSDYSVSGVQEDLQGNYWVATLNNGILVVPSVSITRTKAPANGEDHFAGMVAIPGTDSVVLASKSGQLLGMVANGQLQQLASIPVNQLYDVSYVDEALFVCSHPYVAQLENGRLQTVHAPGVPKHLAVLDDYVLGYSWYSSCLVNRSFQPDSNAQIPALAAIEQSARNEGVLINEPFQQLWAKPDGSALVGASMGRCKRMTDSGAAFLDSLDGKPLKVADITTDENKVGYVLSTQGTVYRIDPISLELVQVAQFSCSSVPERLCVSGDLLLVYSNGELLFRNRQQDQQFRFRDLMHLVPNELVDLAASENNVWLAYSNSVFRVPMADLKTETEALVQTLQLDGVEPTENGYALGANPGPVRVLLNYTDVLAQPYLQYSYQLNNEDWIVVERITDVLTLTNLAAGSYTLRVRVLRGYSTVNERSLTFSIAPPWHQSAWFTAVLIVLVFAGTVLFFRAQIRRLKKRNAANQRLNEAQLTALKAQMNPHFLFNVLNSMQTMVLKEDKLKANKIMSELSVFVRQTLNYSDKAHVPVQDELEMIQNYLKLEKHRFADDFAYQMVVDSSLDEWLHLHIPPMLIQPFVENAINHGLLHKKHDRKLTVSFSSQQQQFICVLEDNGVGRKRAAELQAQSKKHQSFASGASARRIALLRDAGHANASIDIEDLHHANQQPAGTRVTIRLPLTTPT